MVARLPEPLSSVPAAAYLAAIAVIVLLLLFAVIVPSCSHKPEPQQTGQAQSQAQVQSGIVHTVVEAKSKAKTAVDSASQVGSLETSNTNVQALVTLLGEEETAKLISQAKTNPEALWIAAHPSSYAFEGVETQYKLLKLAADEPAAVPFVRYYPSKYPMAEAVADKDLAVAASSSAASAPASGIPLLYQWDRRWGYTLYGEGSLGLFGSAPTSLAMVYQGLTGNTDYTPYDLAKRAQEGNFVLEGGETANELFTEVAPELGLSCEAMEPDAAAVSEALSEGRVIIANMGPGHFTTTDHFLVLTDMADDGQVVVHDPYSAVHSVQAQDLGLVVSESLAMFSFAY